MNTYMNIEEIRVKYYNGDYECKMDIPHAVKEDHVFDENLSVKRNREMTEEHNSKIRDMQRERNDKNAELRKKLRYDVILYIMNTYDMSESQAVIVEACVYNNHHSFMNEYFDAIDEVATMVENVLANS